MTARRRARPPEQLTLDVELAARVIDAARRFAAASRAVETMALRPDLTPIVERDAALHDLLRIVGEPCACTPGTCPFDDDEALA